MLAPLTPACARSPPPSPRFTQLARIRNGPMAWARCAQGAKATPGPQHHWLMHGFGHARGQWPDGMSMYVSPCEIQLAKIELATFSV